MKKMYKTQNSKHGTQKGITLVALVITIIVLLILAGVAINMAINSDGLFGKANEAADKYSEARKNESTAISDLFDTLTEIETGIKVEQVTDAKPGELEGSGTEAEPYIINSIEDLVFFSYDVKQGNTYVDKTVKLGLNLDFNSTKSYVDAFRKDYSKYGYNGELQSALTTGEGFQSIGTIEDIKDGTSCFQGTFDGNNKSIYNLYINGVFGEIDTNFIGLFGTNNGTIKNLKLENVNITASTNVSPILVGSIAGRNYGTVTQCLASGEINITNNAEGAAARAGGVVGQGQANSKLDKSGNKTNIFVVVNKGNTMIGGIVGQQLNSSIIELCYNSGNIIFTDNIGSYGSRVSGISNRGVSNCYNRGNINVNTSLNTENLRVAGVDADIFQECTNLYNTGDITVNGNSKGIYVGGVGGVIQESTLSNSINFGKITANSDSLKLGGVLGYSYQGTVNNIYNIGTISGEGTTSNYRGLLLGRIHTATLTNGYYKVQGEELAVGNNLNSTEENISVLTSNINALSILGSAFVADENNINEGYPILSWQE